MWGGEADSECYDQALIRALSSVSQSHPQSCERTEVHPKLWVNVLTLLLAMDRTEVYVQGKDDENYYFCFVNHPARALATFEPQAARKYKIRVCKMSAAQPSFCPGSDALVG